MLTIRYEKDRTDDFLTAHNEYFKHDKEKIDWSFEKPGSWSGSLCYGVPVNTLFNGWRRTWGADGTGQWIDWAGTQCDVQSNPWQGNYTLPPTEWGSVYCDVSAHRWKSEGNYSTYHERMLRSEVTYELQTGGKAKYKEADRLIILTSAGYAILDPFWSGNDSDPNVDGYWIPKGEIELGDFGPLIPPDGKLYVALPPNTKRDVTPRSKGKKFVKWMKPQVAAHDLVIENVATTPSDRKRTTVGVGEITKLYFEPALAFSVEWSVTAGSRFPLQHNYTMFTAPSNAVPKVFVIAVLPAPAGTPLGQKPRLQKEFEVIKPTGIQATVRGLPDAFPFDPPSVGAGMQLDVVIQPTTVSFSRIQMKEPTEPTTGLNGYFIANPPPGHTGQAGANDWHNVSQSNLVLGPPENFFDHAWSSAGALNASGTYTWPIHPVWRVGELHTAPSTLPGWTDQVHTLTSGTMKIEKLGRTVTRGPSEPRGTAQ